MKNIAELERRITMLERELVTLRSDKKDCQDDADDIRDEKTDDCETVIGPSPKGGQILVWNREGLYDLIIKVDDLCDRVAKLLDKRAETQNANGVNIDARIDFDVPDIASDTTVSMPITLKMNFNDDLLLRMKKDLLNDNGWSYETIRKGNKIPLE